ncbi:4-hydroxybenzoate synthetase (chorismate lyase) protein, putative (macronuclear) [Tetrahymena thermophila SB210]|uniref:4-hydroxybenzoate synthetase (Chorismate lyase) protein, putative n=1 Tax=Tetrahymena thermophila (strain SB210) TaxID=312017 RepID=Q230Y9_TETTS|nr:4-hydroxybenzoate synthetase (chorismate lyase) protein, putative [Tetrahymena thermophila SB210]EAR91150.1 4-hydroxybenzoate synthetase (chorismate lyase) protein, putative [Tetrahymena thermophila SB210]|eukprot:XP_001011395.1 4-hydroxybenzoate synthetase (chorismate lyase) protein, putative [Tetrahymena thermophila SB210]
MENSLKILQSFTRDSTDSQFTTMWRLILLSDGSNTKNLESITQETVKTEVVSEEDILNEQKALANESLLFNIFENKTFSDSELVKRVVILNSKQQPLVYARSYWPKAKYEQVMKNKQVAIGHNMTQAKLEYFREIKSINTVLWDDKLNSYNGEGNDQKENFARGYIIYKNGEPMTYIEEFFTHQINKFLN